MAETKKAKQITTGSGFTCEIAEDAFNDMRILDALVELQIGNFGEKMIALKTVLDRFMGPNQKESCTPIWRSCTVVLAWKTCRLS